MINRYKSHPFFELRFFRALICSSRHMSARICPHLDAVEKGAVRCHDERLAGIQGRFLGFFLRLRYIRTEQILQSVETEGTWLVRIRRFISTESVDAEPIFASGDLVTAPKVQVVAFDLYGSSEAISRAFRWSITR